MENRYWNNSGKYQDLMDQLEQKIPAIGTVDNPRKNRHLDRLRRAMNCYHDLYNNGLFNHAKDFRRLFGIASSHFKLWGCGEFIPELYVKTEAKMDEFVLLAATEQLGHKLVDVAS